MLSSAVRSVSKGLGYVPAGSRSLVTQVVQYERHGDPLEVLRLGESTVDADRLGKSGVYFRMLASPVNPADLNQIQGVYPVAPPLPAVGGNEGVAEVLAVGSDVRLVKKGDWFIPAAAGLGTWRTHGVWDESQVLPIPKDVPVEFAATLSVNPCTAYRMLQDFATLRKGDAVIQNGANGGVGKAVVQLAKRWGIKTVNIVRKRDDFAQVERALMDLGATVVVTDEDLAKAALMGGVVQKHLGGTLPQLALNCVGGDNATHMLRYLRDGGTMVTYGGMSKKPVVAPTGSLIFKDHSFRGFWMTRWSQESTAEKRQQMLLDLCGMARGGLFKVDAEAVPFADFQRAIKDSKTGKQLLVMK